MICVLEKCKVSYLWQ